MNLVYTFLIALANNIDNIGVRLAYSIKGIKISTLNNLWISIITFFISTISAYSGASLSSILGRKFASYFSMIILSIIGALLIVDAFKENKKPCSKKETDNIINILNCPEIADMDNSKEIDFKEATILGIALSLNNVGGGLSAGMIGLNVIFVGLLSAVLSFLALWAGNFITVFFRKLNIGSRANLFAGLLLIILGIKQIL
jgi:putative sporulation protein YtaF